MSKESPHLQHFLAILNDPGSWNKLSNDKKELTEQALNQLDHIDYSEFDIDEIEKVQDSNIPDELAVKIVKGWVQRQNDILSNIYGDILYKPEIPTQCLQEFYDMIRCPTSKSKDKLIVENILYQIATGGGKRQPVPLIKTHLVDGARKYDDSIIKFNQSEVDFKNIDPNPLFDFSKDTVYHNTMVNNPFFVIGFPSFMKIRLTSYKLTGPPRFNDRPSQGGPKNWDIFGHDGKKFVQIHSVNNDDKLKQPNSEHTYEVKTEQYFRFFKFQSHGLNHQNSYDIMLSGIDFTGNVITVRD